MKRRGTEVGYLIKRQIRNGDIWETDARIYKESRAGLETYLKSQQVPKAARAKETNDVLLGSFERISWRWSADGR